MSASDFPLIVIVAFSLSAATETFVPPLISTTALSVKVFVPTLTFWLVSLSVNWIVAFPLWFKVKEPLLTPPWLKVIVALLTVGIEGVFLISL